jgi:hypothetical protein
LNGLFGQTIARPLRRKVPVTQVKRIEAAMADHSFAIVHEHYHVTDAGMRSVLETLSKGIYRYFPGASQFLWYSPKKVQNRQDPGEPFADRYVTLIEDDALGYLTRSFDSVDAFLEQVNRRKQCKIKTLSTLFEKYDKVVHWIQNPTLLKNPVETQANVTLARDLVGQDYIQVWHIHDLLEDAASRRSLRAHIKKLVGEKTEKVFGVNGSGICWSTSPNIFYAVINMKAHWALQNLMLPAQRDFIFYFPDAVDTDFRQDGCAQEQESAIDDLLVRYCSGHRAEGYRFDPDAELLIAAEMARERKNTGEQILLLNTFNAAGRKSGRQFQLLVTLLPDQGSDRQRIEIFKAYIRDNRLPVVMGFGKEIVSRGNQRETGKFRLSDLWNHPRAFAEISTSVKEGFGLNFIGPAVASSANPYSLPTVGRRLREVFPDFEAAGLVMPEKAYYDAIVVAPSILRDGLAGLDEKKNTLRPLEFENRYTAVPSGLCISLGRDFCSYSAGEQILLMDCIDYEKLADALSVFLAFVFDRVKMNTVAKHNAQAVSKNLSLKPYVDRLTSIVEQAFVFKEKRLLAGEQPAMIRDNRKLSKFYRADEKAAGIERR